MTVPEAIALISADAALYDAVVKGPVSGPTSTVTLAIGITVPTIARAISDLTAEIVAGNAHGYVATWANDAARALKVPEQAEQLGIQVDTKAIYYASSTAMGAWVFHPVQNAASDAATAVAAVATLTTALGNKMTTATYVGGSASGVVRQAELVKCLVDMVGSNAHCSLHILGVEDGVHIAVPALTINRAVSLIDGVEQHTSVSNTSRRCQSIGTNFAFVNTPRRFVSWGAQTRGGVLGSGVTATQSMFSRSTIALQQPDRNLPDFDPFDLYTGAGQIVEASAQGAVTVARTADGIILVAGANAQGVKAIFGSGVDKLQSVLMPIYFNNSGSNKPIAMFDVQDSTVGTTNATAVFVDNSENVWLLTNNPANAGYGNTLSGPQNIPVKLNTGYPGWSGFLVRKVRCDCTGNIYVLFTNGQLWAGGGSNATGQLGTGSTGAVLNPVQIAVGVDDFDVSGQESGTSLACWILQSGTLSGAGYNANGQLGQTTGPTANHSSFVTIAADVDLMRVGGTDTVSVIYRNTSGSFFGLGKNSDGVFGEGAFATTNNVPVLLTNLTTLVTDNGGLVDLVISGYNGKHAACAVCANGTAWAAGNNTDGVLANGTTANTNTFQQMRWSPRDSTEFVVDVSSAVGPSIGPAFTLRTSHGRVMMAGAMDKGFATGVTPQAVGNQLIASPVQLGTL